MNIQNYLPCFFFAAWDQVLGFCSKSGYTDRYSTLREAKMACKNDVKCIGTVDECGDGHNFGTCTTSIIPSRCGSIFYNRRSMILYHKI